MLLLSCVLLPETRSARERGTDLAAARPDAGDAYGLVRDSQDLRVSEEGATPRPAVSCCAVRVVLCIPAAEFFDPPCGLDPLLPARPPRMMRIPRQSCH